MARLQQQYKEQIVPALVKTGIAPEDARRVSLSGCHEVIVTGRAQMGSVEGFINLPKMLRLTLGLEPEIGQNPVEASTPEFKLDFAYAALLTKETLDRLF